MEMKWFTVTVIGMVGVVSLLLWQASMDLREQTVRVAGYEAESNPEEMADINPAAGEVYGPPAASAVQAELPTTQEVEKEIFKF